MSRVIALEEGLDDIGNYLRGKGFHIVSWQDHNSAVDAVVYTGRKLEDIQATQYSLAAEETLSADIGSQPFGVLLVNAQGKTPDEVYKIIKNRIYEHIL